MIKNYYSTVSVSKSVNHIENRLIEFGAKSVNKICDNGKITGITFIISVNGNDTPFRLKARTEEIKNKIMETVKRPRDDTDMRAFEQAERVAWKLISDDVDIQLSLIEIDQKKFIEAFLSSIYSIKKDQTFFEQMEASNFSMLEYKK